MTSKKVTVKVSSEAEARPIAMLVQVASRFSSSVTLVCGDVRVNAKSIMGMMGLGLVSGKEIEIMTDGDDEKEACREVAEYLTEN